MTQEEAFELLKLGFNVFLTGAAGAGKTFVLNRYIRHLREHGVEVAVTASTGIAATHLNGQTIHSWSGVGIREAINQQELDALVGKDVVRRRIKKTKVLVIDEISMLHAHFLDLVDLVTRTVLDESTPFGGLQVIVCGDFFQLPPVAKDRQEVKFAFQSRVWQQADFRVCYLLEQHRQSADPLLSVLNQIRDGVAGEQTKIPLRTRYKKPPLGPAGEALKASVLYPRNINVDQINQRELLKLPGQISSFSMSKHGFSKHTEALTKSCLAPEVLELKIGAQVMFVKNSPEGHYVNGTRGVVHEFDNEGWPRIKTFDGAFITATPVDWNFEEGDTIRASISQIPLRLAWAITIHKSQGMTLDACEVDLSDAFEPGMGYVALSRVRSLAGLNLLGLNQVALSVNDRVLEEDKNFRFLSEKARSNLNELSLNQRAKLVELTLIERFEGKKATVNNSEVKAKKGKKPKNSNKVEKKATVELTRELVLRKLSLEQISIERDLKLSTVIDHLEQLNGRGKLPDISYIRDSIAEDDFERIEQEFRDSEDGKLAPIFANLGKQYSFETLKLVRLFVNQRELND